MKSAVRVPLFLLHSPGLYGFGPVFVLYMHSENKSGDEKFKYEMTRSFPTAHRQLELCGLYAKSPGALGAKFEATFSFLDAVVGIRDNHKNKSCRLDLTATDRNIRASAIFSRSVRGHRQASLRHDMVSTILPLLLSCRYNTSCTYCRYWCSSSC